MEEALAGADLVVVAVPSKHLRHAVTQASGFVAPGTLVLSVAKGIEIGSCRRMSEVIADVLSGHDRRAIGVLAGPNLSREVMAGHPAATCVAFPGTAAAGLVQKLFMGDSLRVYTNTDVVGCEIGGAVKNVIAIAAGVADGLGYGMNTKAALVTRGLAELTRLGVALGGDPLTFLGLAGNGDLIATCSSPQSRNHFVGAQRALGRAIADILGEMNMVAEGVETAPAVLELARRSAIVMPISATVAALLTGELSAGQMVSTLMHPEPKAELQGLSVEPGGMAWAASTRQSGARTYPSGRGLSGAGIRSGGEFHEWIMRT